MAANPNKKAAVITLSLLIRINFVILHLLLRKTFGDFRSAFSFAPSIWKTRNMLEKLLSHVLFITSAVVLFEN